RRPVELAPGQRRRHPAGGLLPGAGAVEPVLCAPRPDVRRPVPGAGAGGDDPGLHGPAVAARGDLPGHALEWAGEGARWAARPKPGSTDRTKAHGGEAMAAVRHPWRLGGLIVAAIACFGCNMLSLPFFLMTGMDPKHEPKCKLAPDDKNQEVKVVILASK